MATEIAVSGLARRVEYSEKPGKNGGVYRNGKVVLAGEFDKLEVELGMSATDAQIRALRAVKEGADVTLHVEVSSGDGWRSPARFTFLDDLTPAQKS
jgi:hypothetical protein